MNALRIISLLAATMTVGLTAGAFCLYAHTVMPGLATTDDRTFVAAFQALDRAIINPWFLGGGFLGAMVSVVVAALAHLGTTRLPWIVVALVLYAVAFVITMAIHVPMNDRLKAAGLPDDVGELATIRARFDEARWRRWNRVRVVTSALAFGLLVWTG